MSALELGESFCCAIVISTWSVVSLYSIPAGTTKSWTRVVKVCEPVTHRGRIKPSIEDGEHSRMQWKVTNAEDMRGGNQLQYAKWQEPSSKSNWPDLGSDLVGWCSSWEALTKYGYPEIYQAIRTSWPTVTWYNWVESRILTKGVQEDTTLWTTQNQMNGGDSEQGTIQTHNTKKDGRQTSLPWEVYGGSNEKRKKRENLITAWSNRNTSYQKSW